jgi:hypothetical protein
MKSNRNTFSLSQPGGIYTKKNGYFLLVKHRERDPYFYDKWYQPITSTRYEDHNNEAKAQGVVASLDHFPPSKKTFPWNGMVPCIATRFIDVGECKNSRQLQYTVLTAMIYYFLYRFSTLTAYFC